MKYRDETGCADDSLQSTEWMYFIQFQIKRRPQRMLFRYRIAYQI